MYAILSTGALAILQKNTHPQDPQTPDILIENCMSYFKIEIKNTMSVKWQLLSSPSFIQEKSGTERCMFLLITTMAITISVTHVFFLLRFFTYQAKNVPDKIFLMSDDVLICMDHFFCVCDGKI